MQFYTTISLILLVSNTAQNEANHFGKQKFEMIPKVLGLIEVYLGQDPYVSLSISFQVSIITQLNMIPESQLQAFGAEIPFYPLSFL